MLRRKSITLILLPWLGRAFLASPAAAKTHEFEPATLRWVRAQDAAVCPDEWELARAVEARLGPGALVPPANAKLVVDASIRARMEGGFDVDIALLRDDTVVGRRELSSPEPNCSAAAEQAALVIALAIDPEASALDPPQPAVSAPPVVTAVRAPEPVSVPPAGPPAALPEVAAGSPWEADMELAAGVATGIVPEITPGFFVRGRGRPPRFALAIEVEGAYFPPTNLDLEPGRGAHFTLLYLGVALCNRPRRARPLRVSLCGGPDLAAMTGQGHGFDRTPRFSSYSLALSARARLGFRVARGLALVLGPDMVIPFGRDRFVAITADGTEELFRMKAVGFGFELGAVWEL
jgi:hypothetical protein